VAEVVLDQISKVYPNGFQAVKDLSLTLSDGEFLVLVGPSGCGKSTALRMIAGLEDISSGKLSIGGREVNDVHPKDRDIAMVFQNYALYPHMTVGDNIGFALKLAKVPRDEIRQRVHAAAETLELVEQLDKRPGQLSGGQRQRVAMGRAIVRQPAAFLMDEPLSNLDAKLRVQMRAEIAALQRDLGVTTFYVTHDQVEAMTMGDRVAVIKDGILQQVDSPQSLYDNPVNIFVAAFIGSPSMNLYSATLSIEGSGAIAQLGSNSLRIPASVLESRPALQGYDGRTVTLGLRPEDLDDAAIADDSTATQTIDAEVMLVESLGAEIMVHFSIDATPVESGDPDAADEGPSGPSGRARCVARFNPRSRVTLGQSITVTVDTARFHYFDAETGNAITD